MQDDTRVDQYLTALLRHLLLSGGYDPHSPSTREVREAWAERVFRWERLSDEQQREVKERKRELIRTVTGTDYG